ncbi:MAG: hypothetical protein ABI112_12290 [Terracoccus sp.]
MEIKELTDWIDSDLNELRKTHLFKDYFDKVEIIEGVNSKYLTNKAKGIEIVISIHYKVTSIHLFSGTVGDYRRFDQELPFNVKFSLSRKDIHEIFGTPNKSGGGVKSLYVEFILPWDKYFFEAYSIHFQYKNETINKITIGSLKLEEYFNSELQ